MQAAEVPQQLQSCQHVYVRGDGARPPLAAKYDGPFLVVGKAAKYFRIQRGSTVETRHGSGGSSLTPRLRSASEGRAEGRGHPPRVRPRTAGRGLGGLCNERRFNV